MLSFIQVTFIIRQCFLLNLAVRLIEQFCLKQDFSFVKQNLMSLLTEVDFFSKLILSDSGIN